MKYLFYTWRAGLKHGQVFYHYVHVLDAISEAEANGWTWDYDEQPIIWIF